MNVPKKQSGTYECRHFLGDRIISSDRFQLKVYNSINMEGNKDSYIGIETESFSMSCSARFDSEATEAGITWLHNNLPIKDGQGQFDVMNTVIQSITQKKVRSVSKNQAFEQKKMKAFMFVKQFMTTLYWLTLRQLISIWEFNLNRVFLKTIERMLWISDAPGPIIVNVTCLVICWPCRWFPMVYRTWYSRWIKWGITLLLFVLKYKY